MRDATLVFPVHNDRVLLGLKKAGFGAGKYNGFGGKVERGESVTHAAVRELEEEVGIRVEERDLFPAAVLTFLFPAKPEWDQVVHAFLAKTWMSEPRESDEMRPRWFHASQLPLATMWQDDSYWLPRVLAGNTITATFTFGEDNETVIDARIEENSVGNGG